MAEVAMSNRSASSIVELSRSKSRYHDQDALLKGFVGCDGWTAKEVAVEVLDWRYEQYANCPKRAFDLHRLGYLERLEGKVCRHTSKEAHTYRITERGLAHLRAIGMAIAPRPNEQPTVSETDQSGRISALRGLLGPS
jgi:hypothetical protein